MIGKLLLLILLFCAQLTWAQNKITIQSNLGEVIPGAKFEAISYPDSVFVIQKISDAEGAIYLDEVTGEFSISVSYFGFELYKDTVAISTLEKIILTKVQIIDDMVVTAQSKAVSVESAIQKITVINSDQIEKSGANNLADILAYQTGIRLAQDNVLGSSMDLGGISGQNVKILVDGVPVIGRQNGNVDLSQINLNNVERIEVVQGPLSVNYGSNALAGTVNIITKKKSKKGYTIEINPFYETIGNYNLSGAFSANKNGHIITLDGGRNYFDGWTESDPFVEFPKKSLADTNRVKTWKPKEQYYGGARYLYGTQKYEASVYVNYFDELIVNRGMPSSPYYETAFDDYYSTIRLDAGVSSSFNFKKSKLTSLLAFNDFKRTKNTYYKDLTDLSQVLSKTEGAQDTSRFNQFMARIIYSGELGKKMTYQIGADLNHSTGWGRRIDNGSRAIGDYAGFLTVDWKITDSLIIKPGVRYAYNTAYESPIIPSLNILYRVKKISIRGSVARGFRAPDLKELYMDFVDINHNILGNKNLKAETSTNYSLFVNWIKPLKNKRLIKIEYGAYYNEIDNLITLGTIDNNVFTYINIGDYSTIGQQVVFNYRAKRWNVNVNATYIGRFNPDSKMSTVEHYSFSPEIGTQLNCIFIKDKLQANVFYKYNGKLQSFYIDFEDDIQSVLQAGYHILDASVTWNLLKHKQLSFTVGAKNILNVTQVNILGQNQTTAHSTSSNINAGRGASMFVSARYKFNFNKSKL
ncbi:MAG: outer membrane receptor for ferrienterochelin and colicins [Crocinitomicaceae bacterium]|jgi:outer membrane receptor for ferrienterochelin and colicins